MCRPPAVANRKGNMEMGSIHREDLHLFASAFTYAAIGMALVALDGTWMAVNPAMTRILGYSKEEFIRLSFQDITHPEDLSADLLYVKRMIEGEIDTYQMEKRYLHKDGQEVWALLSVSLVKDGQQSPQFFISQIQDISDRKRMEEHLRLSDKLALTGQMAAGIAHEIRNPLSSIKGFIQLIRSQGAKPGYLEIIESEFNRIETILNELLMLAKPQQRVIRQHDAVKLVGDVISLLVPQANLNRVRIEADCPSEPILIECDENQIKQAFINVLKNAIESMPDGGTVYIRCRQTRGSVRITFEDEGGGIPDEVLNKLGEPFNTTKESGTGLGIMITYNLIHIHNGSIRIRNEDSRGTIVEIDLPMNQPGHTVGAEG